MSHVQFGSDRHFNVVRIVCVCACAVYRPRPHPASIGDRKYRFESSVRTYSFPSGDTSCCAVYTVCCVLIAYDLWPNNWPFQSVRHIMAWSLLGLIPLTAFGRVYFGCHYWLDTFAGALLGSAVALLMYMLVTPAAVDALFGGHQLTGALPNNFGGIF